MEINDRSVPPGFRFHPTEEELVGYYLMRKINSLEIDLDVIVDIDLYRIEPWDIQDKCKLGYAEQNEWYFFSHKDKKYPTGTRTNRATAAGFWKATGRDKAVVSGNKIIGMRKTLVYYKGRAPNGTKSDWIMHEYRLQTSQNAPPQEEGWVVCRAFKKPSPSSQRPYGYDPCWHLMNRSTAANTTTNATAFLSPLPGLTDSNYSHPATTMSAAFHQQPLPVAFDFDHQQMGSGSCTLAENYSQQGFETNINTHRDNHDGGLYEDYKSSDNWRFFNTMLGCDDQIPEQAPSCSLVNDPTSQFADHHLDTNTNGDQDEQVGHFLACFNSM